MANVTSSFKLNAMPEPSAPVQGEGINGRRGSQSNVFARIQALWPLGTRPYLPGAGEPQLPPSNSAQPLHKFLKVRIVSWNMHDSLPKGNLDELLGAVPKYNPSERPLPEDLLHLPNLSLDDQNPCHLIVVAGQECPTVSGIPMGFGAGFKHRDKDKERAKQLEKDYEKQRSNSVKKSKSKDRVKERRPDQAIPEVELSDDGSSFMNDQAVTTHSGTSGWSALLENRLCRDSCSPILIRNPSTAKVSEYPRQDLLHPPPRKRNGPMSEVAHNAIGAYELLIKERLMGIYLAVFIHRDVKSLVRGTDRSVVTAGLIGGRVGNKGGVAISLNFDGTTFLFVNAHLAAHEDRVAQRLADWAKIKSELEIENYLRSDDPRMVAEDLTDKFDHTFLFGDLNFRLNVTRLHADWLISRQDYAQALAFDQLREEMQKGVSFSGFREADINFPPTFKYDVLRTLKGSKSIQKNKHHHRKRQTRDLSGVAERDDIEYEQTAEEEDDDIHSDDDDTVSVASTGLTSSQSLRSKDEDGSKAEKRRSRIVLAPLVLDTKFLNHAAHKAKQKWLSLLSPSTRSLSAGSHVEPKTTVQPTTPLPSSLPPYEESISVTRFKDSPVIHSISAVDLPTSGSGGVSSRPSFKRRRSTHSLGERPFANHKVTGGEGVYDSSSKQRVPSWCDRILWKSTVDPGSEDDVEPVPSLERSFFGPRLSQLLPFLRPRSLTSKSSRSRLSEGDEPTTGRDTPTGPFSILTEEPKSISQAPENSIEGTIPGESRNALSITTAPIVGKASSSPHSPVNPRTQRGRSYSATFVPTETDVKIPNGRPLRPASTLIENSIPHPSSPNTPRWRFLPFLPWEASSQSSAPTSVRVANTHSRPRKGDVVSLRYSALDDQAMRRLGGRSDHRPVVGVYAIYL